MGFKRSISCRLITCYVKHAFLLGLAAQCFADSDTSIVNQPIKNLSTPFSRDVALVDNFTQKKPTLEAGHRKADMDLQFGRPITEKKLGAALYKALDNPKKFAEQAAATTLFTGLDAIGLAEPVKKGVNYIKDKTRFDFGKCGKVRIRNQVSAASCLTDESSIELQSDYNMDSVTLNFKWSL